MRRTTAVIKPLSNARLKITSMNPSRKIPKRNVIKPALTMRFDKAQNKPSDTPRLDPHLLEK